MISLKRSRSNRKIASGSRSTRLLREQPARAVEEGAAVGDPAQRVDQRVDLVLQLGALLGHVEQQERHDHGEQQRAEGEQRERDAAHQRVALEHRREIGRRDAREQRRRIGEQHDDGRPARHQRLVAAAPEFLRGGRRQHRHHRRDHDDAQVDIVGESRDAAHQQPQDRREHDDQRPHLAAVEHARARPDQPVGEQHQRIADIDRDEVGDRAARRHQPEPGRADDLRGAPPHRRADAAVLQPGKDQERAEQRGHEDRYDRKGPDIEMHEDDRPPADLGAAI